MKVELVILGEPECKQRPRYSLHNGIVRTYTPSKTTNYEAVIRHEYTQKYGTLLFDMDTAVKVSVVAYFGLSKVDFCKKGLSKSGKDKMEMVYCTKHKDLDNIIKICLDSLNGVCYRDDKQIVSINACKKWTLNDPRVEIIIEKMELVSNNGRENVYED